MYPVKSTHANQTLPDGYMLETHYAQFDDLGQIHSSLYTPRMTYYLQDNTSLFDRPKLTAYTGKRIPWTVNAAYGKSIHGGEQIDLSGGVQIYQAPQPGYPETIILTNTIQVFPHQSYAETNEAIAITRPDTHIEAIGMQAYFKSGIFKLLSNVTGSYEPKSPHY